MIEIVYDLRTKEWSEIEVPDVYIPDPPTPEPTDEISSDEALAIIMGGAT